MAVKCQVCETEAKPAELKTWTKESFTAKDKAGKSYFLNFYLCPKCLAFVKSLGPVRAFLEKHVPKDLKVIR